MSSNTQGQLLIVLIFALLLCQKNAFTKLRQLSMLLNVIHVYQDYITEEFVFNLYNLWQFLLLCMEVQFLVVWDQRVCNCMVVHRCTCALKCFYAKCLDGHYEQQQEIHAVAYYFQHLIAVMCLFCVRKVVYVSIKVYHSIPDLLLLLFRNLRSVLIQNCWDTQR